MSNELIPMSDIEKMGKAIAESGLFGMKTPAQAIALMLIAQAEGKHPAIAARDYHIIQGKPSLKADAMLARFQEYGGKFKWLSYSETECEAQFSHPTTGELTIKWTWEMAERVKSYDKESNKWVALTEKHTYKSYPRQMLSARVISEGVRKLCPAACNGMYTPEEVQDFEEKPKLIETVARVIRSEPAPQLPAPQPEQTPEAAAEPAEQRQAPQGGEITATGFITEVTEKSGKKKDGTSWTNYGVVINGIKHSTFSKSLGSMCKEYSGKCEVDYIYTYDGKYYNLIGVEPSTKQLQKEQLEPPIEGKENARQLTIVSGAVRDAIGADNWDACKALLAKKYAEYGTLSSILLAKSEEIIAEIKTKGAKAYIEDLPF